MSGLRWKIIAIAVVAAMVVAIGYVVVRRDFGSLAGLEASDGLTLYSIDGRDFAPGKEPQTAEKFHSYPVLGKTDIKDPRQRADIIRAMQEGVALSQRWRSSKCFWPRHGLRAVSNGKTVDLVICFECDWLHVFIDDDEEIVEHLSDAPQALLNSRLQEANVPLAPPSLEGFP